MNQQRARRFRSAQEAKENDQKKEELHKMLAQQHATKTGEQLVREEVVQKTWDSNVITPGTPFMDILAASLRYWIAYKLNTDPGWENVCFDLFYRYQGNALTLTAENHHFGCHGSRRRRAQDHEFYTIPTSLA